MNVKQNILTMVLCCLTIVGMAQKRLDKMSKTFKVNENTTIELNTRYVQVEIDTWNQNAVEIEAYVESDQLSKDELEKILADWDLTVDTDNDLLKIESYAHNGTWRNGNNYVFGPLNELEKQLADLPEVPEFPEVPENIIPKTPELPEFPELPEGIDRVQFDYEAYKKDGEAYLESWSKIYEETYGKAYKEKMKAWARKLGKIDIQDYSERMKEWGKNFSNQFGEDYAIKIKNWSEKFNELWNDEFVKRVESFERDAKESSRGGLTKKIIKIKIPKKAKLKTNIRHGNLKLLSLINNLNAELSHTILEANHIEGSKTSISVSYAPVQIEKWSKGELNLNYVNQAQIKKTERLILNSKSSNISMGDISKNAIINGSFGDLNIDHISDTFNTLNIVLKNSDALISLPKVAHSFQFQGNHSRLKHPQKPEDYEGTSFSVGDLNNGKTIVVNAKYSKVTMK